MFSPCFSISTNLNFRLTAIAVADFNLITLLVLLFALLAIEKPRSDALFLWLKDKTHFIYENI